MEEKEETAIKIKKSILNKLVPIYMPKLRREYDWDLDEHISVFMSNDFDDWLETLCAVNNLKITTTNINI